MKFFRLSTRSLVLAAIIGALYAVLTVIIAPISYGPIQFRISEALKVFVLFNPVFALGIGIGTFFANMLSPFVGPWELVWMPFTDMAGGLLAWAIYKLLRRHLPAIPMLVYALTTSAAVALMLYFYGLGAFWFLGISVLVSEAIIMLAGIPLIFYIVKMLKMRDIQLDGEE